MFITSCRAELSSEDDLSLESDSDTMDVDSTPQDGGREKRQGLAILGKAGSVAGALVPDTWPQFTVSPCRLDHCSVKVYTILLCMEMEAF